MQTGARSNAFLKRTFRRYIGQTIDMSPARQDDRFWCRSISLQPQGMPQTAG